MPDIIALADVATEYTAPNDTDLLFIERGGVAGKITPPNLFSGQAPAYTRAQAEAANVDAQVNAIIVDGLAFTRDAAGTALTTNDGATWSPASGTQASVLHWGIDLTGATDDGTALRAARAWCIANDRSLLSPEGVYNDAGTTYTRDFPFLWYPGDNDSASVAYWTLVQRSFLLQQTLGAGASRLVGHHYMVEADDPNNVEPVKVNLTATAGSGHTGVYINTTGSASAQWMAGYHAETRAEGSSAHINFNSETRCYDPTQAVYGHVIKMSSGSTVAETDPSLNVNHPTTGNPPVYNPNAVGIYIHGNADTDADKGGWPKAILVSNAAIDEDGVVMEVNAPAGANLLYNTAMVCSDSVIRDDASNNRFIDLRGTVNIGFRMVNAPGISAVQIDAATGRALYYPNATDGPAGLRQNAGRWEFESGGTSRLRIDNVTGDIDQIAGAAVASHSLRSELNNALIGQTRYIAKDSGGNDTEYAEIEARALDNTDGAEYGRLSLRASINGAISTVMSLGEAGATTDPVSIFVGGSLQRVTAGAADSAGAGFRQLRVPN